jgi:hypothetical protein
MQEGNANWPGVVAAIAVITTGAPAAADVTISYSPTALNVGETVQLSIRLTANPGPAINVAGIQFHYETGSDAWTALGPTAFTWVPAIMHDPGQWFIDENLPEPQGLAFFPAAAITIAGGGNVEFARLTVTPTAPGDYDLASGLTLFNSMGVPHDVKGGEPFTLTIIDPTPGACCLPDGSCLELSADGCEAKAGAFEGPDTLCDDVECPQPQGACCFGAGGCVFLSEVDCGIASGSWQGSGTDCADGDGDGQADDCACLGDLDGDGLVSTSDLLMLLGAWGDAGGPADLDGDGLVSTSDLLLLLGAWGDCI